MVLLREGKARITMRSGEELRGEFNLTSCTCDTCKTYPFIFECSKGRYGGYTSDGVYSLEREDSEDIVKVEWLDEAVEKKECTCDGYQLLWFGCKCGYKA